MIRAAGRRFAYLLGNLKVFESKNLLPSENSKGIPASSPATAGLPRHRSGYVGSPPPNPTTLKVFVSPLFKFEILWRRLSALKLPSQLSTISGQCPTHPSTIQKSTHPPSPAPIAQFDLQGTSNLQNNRVPPKSGKTSKLKPTRKLPDEAICRTQRHADCLFSCLVDSPQSCQHLLVIGNNFFCIHPSCEAFAARTGLS
jgi:hypothetical protein